MLQNKNVFDRVVKTLLVRFLKHIGIFQKTKNQMCFLSTRLYLYLQKALFTVKKDHFCSVDVRFSICGTDELHATS